MYTKYYESSSPRQRNNWCLVGLKKFFTETSTLWGFFGDGKVPNLMIDVKNGDVFYQSFFWVMFFFQVDIRTSQSMLKVVVGFLAWNLGTHVYRGLNAHCFYMIGNCHQPNTRHLSTHYKDFLCKGWMTIPLIATYVLT